MPNKKKRQYPNIMPVLQVVGTLWALVMVTFLLLNAREVPTWLALIVLAAALGPLFLPVLELWTGRRILPYDSADDKPDDEAQDTHPPN